MTDYRPLLARAIAALDPNTGEARRAVYDRARTALVNQLRGMNPPLAEAEITRQRLSLEEAIRKVEGEATAAPVAPPPPSAARDARPPRGEPPPRPAPATPRRSENGMQGAQDASYDDLNDFEPQPRDPRAPPRGGSRPDPREPAPPQARPEPSLRPRGARGRADYARDDARKASRTKLVVLGIIFMLLLLAGAVGYVHRDRVLSIVAGTIPLGTQQEEDAPAPSQNKSSDRVPQQTQQQTPFAPTQQPAGTGMRALLFEENPGTQQFTSLNGTVTWRTETISPGPGRSPELAVRAEIDIPDRKMKVVLSIRRNPETSGSASHYIEIQFTGNDSFGGIAQVPVVRLKNNEAAQGVPLAGISIRIVQGLFLIGLSAVESDRERNLQTLRSQPWLDIPFIYDNGRRSVIAFEKGPAGEKAMAEAFAAWGG
ncbi:MAG: hypothetical protein K2P86_12230 [Xanthobacteraceae bacterium]|nr:hypothetical protein [Xanthobacteraceae bacterium]